MVPLEISMERGNEIFHHYEGVPSLKWRQSQVLVWKKSVVAIAKGCLDPYFLITEASVFNFLFPNKLIWDGIKKEKKRGETPFDFFLKFCILKLKISFFCWISFWGVRSVLCWYFGHVWLVFVVWVVGIFFFF